jgi:endogenous inhibitor of DNA gyrase (YacG/DUF329 family)
MADPAPRPRGGQCPICGKPAAPGFRPFCSRRCADVDLGRWFGETYRQDAGPPAEDEADDEDAGGVG